MTVVNASRTKQKISEDRSTAAYFLGYGNNYRFSLYWDPKDPHNYKRAFHTYIREVPTLERLNVIFTNPHSMEKKMHNFYPYRIIFNDHVLIVIIVAP